MIQTPFSLLRLLAVMAITGLFVTPSLHADLVGYWNFDDNISDLSGQGNNGQLIGDPVYDGDVPAQLGSGKSMLFDGDDAVILGNPAILNFGTGDFTISAWSKKDSSVDQRGNVYSNGGDNGGGIRSVLAIGEFIVHPQSVVLTLDDNSDKIQPRSGDPRGTGFDPINAPDDQWSHIIGMRAGNEARVYVNGVLADMVILPNGYDLSGQSQLPAYIGVGASANSDPIGAFEKFYTGRIDDVSIWDTALSANDISFLTAGGDVLPIPEPSSIGLLGLAILGFVARCWRTIR